MAKKPYRSKALANCQEENGGLRHVIRHWQGVAEKVLAGLLPGRTLAIMIQVGSRALEDAFGDAGEPPADLVEALEVLDKYLLEKKEPA